MLLVQQIAHPAQAKVLENVIIKPLAIQDFSSLLTTCAKLVLKTVLHALLLEVILAILATQDTTWFLENAVPATALKSALPANQPA